MEDEVVLRDAYYIYEVTYLKVIFPVLSNSFVEGDSDEADEGDFVFPGYRRSGNELMRTS